MGIKLEIGKQRKLAASVLDQNEQVMEADVVWTSSNPAIATVSADGVVTGVSAGSANITATAGLASVIQVFDIVPALIPTTVKISVLPKVG